MGILARRNFVGQECPTYSRLYGILNRDQITSTL